MPRFTHRRRRDPQAEAPTAPAGDHDPATFDGQRLGAAKWVHAGLDRRTRRRDREPRLLLLHVPKTGGTSLRRMLKAHVGDDETFLASGEFQWLGASVDDLRRYRLFTGHNFLEPVYLFPDDPWVTVLMVREPVAWWTSQYKYRQRRIAERNDPAAAEDATLDAWIAAQDDLTLSNPQTSWLLARARIMFDSVLAGPALSGTPRGLGLPGHDLAVLVERLVERITVVGVTDDLLDVYRRTCAVMGWEPEHTRARRDNRSEMPAERLTLGGAQTDRLRRLNLLDAHLHGIARRA